MAAELLIWLIVGHLVRDFLFQTRWMAEQKVKKWDALVIHCLLYTGTIGFFALLGGGLSLWSLALILAAHMGLDRRSFTVWWLKHVNKSDNMPWLVIVHDQVWHLLVLALVTVLETRVF